MWMGIWNLCGSWELGDGLQLCVCGVLFQFSLRRDRGVLQSHTALICVSGIQVTAPHIQLYSTENERFIQWVTELQLYG
jgi:hypothetical protein